MAGKPYTYLIGWSLHNIYYYGVRFAQNCHPDDLWKTYFTSSKYVQEFRLKHGEPDIIKIRKEFLTSNLARLWENNVLRRLNVIKNSKWLNASDNISISAEASKSYGFLGKIHNEKSKQKMKNARIAWHKTHENGMLGKKHNASTLNLFKTSKSTETKKKMSEAKVNKYFGKENPFFGKTHSIKFKEIQSNRMKIKQLGANNSNSKIWFIKYPDGTINKINCLKEFCSNVNESVYKIRNNKSKNYSLVGIG